MKTAGDQSAPDQQSWPKVKCLKLASPGLSSAFERRKSAICLFSWAQSAFWLTLLTTIQSLLSQGGCAIILTSLQLRGPVISVFQLFNWSSDLDKDFTGALRLPRLEILWRSVFSQLDDLCPGFIIEFRNKTRRGGWRMAPEILASIPGLWEGKHAPIVFMCL